MQNVLEQGPDFWRWFNKTQFSYHCVHPMHAKMFSIQILIHFSQIVPRVSTVVLLFLNPFRFRNYTYIANYTFARIRRAHTRVRTDIIFSAGAGCAFIKVRSVV